VLILKDLYCTKIVQELFIRCARFSGEKSGFGVRGWSGEERKAAARLPHSKGMFT
jgi:hypothetical protein